MGFFGSIGKAIGGVISTVGAVTGNPILRGVGGLVTGVSGGNTSRNLPVPTGGMPPIPNPTGWRPPAFGTGAFPVQPTGPYFGPSFGGGGLPVDTNPNRFPVPGGGTVVSPLGTVAKIPKGYHVNRTLERAAVMQQNRGYITPGMQRAVNNVVQAVVRNRHMDVCNSHALRRSARRAKGFIKLSRRLVSYYQPRAHKGKAYIRAKGRK